MEKYNLTFVEIEVSNQSCEGCFFKQRNDYHEWCGRNLLRQLGADCDAELRPDNKHVIFKLVDKYNPEIIHV